MSDRDRSLLDLGAAAQDAERDHSALIGESLKLLAVFQSYSKAMTASMESLRIFVEEFGEHHTEDLKRLARSGKPEKEK